MKLSLKNIPKLIKEVRSFPFKKITLGIDDCGKNIYRTFNSRHPRLFLVRKKTIGVALVDTREYESSATYLKSVNGKNSAAYFSRKAAAAGCTFEAINPNQFIDDIHEIHISASARQGRSLDASYQKKITDYPSDKNNLYFGIFNDKKLVAYLWIITTGELMLMNRIMGHSDFLEFGMMYLLVTSFIQTSFDWPAKVIMYDTLLGGSDGLKLFKKRCGFKPYRAKWILAR